ncbi:MAG: glycosyltransferase [Armatimonadota bacterium]
MRIAIFSESYEPIINGVSVCVSSLREKLTQKGHEIFIFAPANNGYIDKHPNVCRINSTSKLCKDYPIPFPYSQKAKKYFDEIKPDIVHTQTPFILGRMAQNFCSESNTPLVSTNHTMYTEYTHYVPFLPKETTKSIIKNLMKKYYNKCDIVVVPSTPVIDVLRSFGVTSDIEVIKTGVDLIHAIDDTKKQEIRSELGVSENGLILLYVGRVAREKNLNTLISAFKMLLDSDLDITLVVAGGGPALKETQSLAKKIGVYSKIRFLGMLNRTQLEPIYCASDIFAFPSVTETQGIAVCEALSAGLPVVAANAGGLPENIIEGEDGFLVDNSPSAFAEKISLLANDRNLRNKMGSKAKENVLRFSMDSMAMSFENLYNKTIENKKSAIKK